MNEVKEKIFSLFDKDNYGYPFDEEAFERFIKETTELISLDYLKRDISLFLVSRYVDDIKGDLSLILKNIPTFEREEKISFFVRKIPEIKNKIEGTILSIFNGDPACKNKQQIVLSYPGYKAILYYRIAHVFYSENLLLLSRYISEKAHQITGIDINPGAELGDNFFVDHGTGIVIGETAVIGNNVKMYQGVTLGALSLKEGRELSSKKRHPTIEDNVTIYSNSAIFGGETVIGHNSIVGAICYLTSSIPPYSIVRQGEGGQKISPRKDIQYK